MERASLALLVAVAIALAWVLGNPQPPEIPRMLDGGVFDLVEDDGGV